METNHTDARPQAAGEVITFYSYDSAPVRSLSLAHAAWLLAGRGQAKTPVLMIDWDLEAPGLHHYFGAAGPSSAGPRGGVLELFEACRERLRATAGTDAGAQAARVLDAIDLDDYIERVDDSRPLYLMRAGRVDDGYGERVDRLDWDALFGACPALFRTFAARLARRYAHVLVDCRSGRSAAASVCTALLPDKMVGLFTPDPRSLEGLQGVVARALDYRCSHEDEQRPLLVYPLPAPVDAAAGPRRRWRLGDGAGTGGGGYQAVLERMLGQCYGLGAVSLDSYLDEVQLPQTCILGAPLPSGRAHPGQDDRLGPSRGIGALLEWLEPGHFPWRPLAEVRLVQAADALRRRAADADAPAMARELARLADLYLGQQGELEAARRIEEHVAALEAGLQAVEEGMRSHGSQEGGGPGHAWPGHAWPGHPCAGHAWPGHAQGHGWQVHALPANSRQGHADSHRAGEERTGVATPGVATPGVATPGIATPGAAPPGAAAPGVAVPGSDGAGADGAGAEALDHAVSRLQDLIDSRSQCEARMLADSLRGRILRRSVAHPLRRRGAAMIKQVYLQAGDKDALLAFTLDEVSSLEGALIAAAGG